MARIQMDYPAYGLSTMDIIIPQDSDGNSKYSDGDKFRSKKFPVLWLLHGGFGCSSDWLRYTEIERVAEQNELFVVCISAGNSAFADMEEGNHYSTLLNGYIWDLIHEMFPLASDKREDNYICGFSMGGYGALRNGLANPDKYSVIGSFAGSVSMVQQYVNGGWCPGYAGRVFGNNLIGSTNDTWYMAKKLMDEGKAPKIYLCCGTRDDNHYACNIEYRDYLKELGYELIWNEEDCGHEWKFCNHQLEKFVQFLPCKTGTERGFVL